MTLEEQIEKLQSDNEALKAQNAEIIKDLRVARSKNKELDIETYNKAIDELENVKSENAKLNQVLGLKNKEVEKLSTTLNELDTNLKTTKLENTLNEELSKLGLKPTSLRLVKAALKAEAKVDDNGVLIGDKALNEYLSEWIKTEEGLDSIMPSGNAGSGASGGNNNSGVSEAKYFDRNSKEFNLTKQAEVYNVNPTLYNQLKGN